MSERLASTGEILSPSDDFYQFINKEWIDQNPLPPTEVMWGPWNELALSIRKSLKEIAENALESRDAGKGSNLQLVGDFYASGTDMETRNKLGSSPLDNLRSVVESVENTTDVWKVMAQLQLRGTSAFISPAFAEDDKKAGSNAYYIGQGGLGLPNRDYYLKDDESMVEIRGKYKEHISDLFQLAGKSKEEADTAADAVFNLEYALAEASHPEEDIRESDKNYFKFTLDQARSEFPNVDWDTYFGNLGKSDIKDFVLQQPDFVAKVGELLRSTDIKDIKDYLEYSVLDDWAGTLSQEFVTQSFKFHGQVLSGMKEPKPVWEKTIGTLHSTALTEAIGPLYCERHFNPETKVKVMEMVEDVREAFRERVKNLEWMSRETKELTWKKLDNIVFKMGFPDQWMDVSGVDIAADAYTENLMNLSEFDTKKRLADLEKPFDKDEWLMPPTLVNACSDLKREMTYPAAILQYPFFDASRDDAYNYGAIGMVIGHELTHFFDDQGCKFDLDGNMNDWWSEGDRERFQALTPKFVEYYNTLEVNGLKVNGQLTLGENIADDAGITIGFEALQRKLARENDWAIVDGLTPEQRYFVGYAKVWAETATPEVEKELILTDRHSPAEVRVNGPLAINPAFHEAFDVRPGDKMYIAPEDRPVLW